MKYNAIRGLKGVAYPNLASFIPTICDFFTFSTTKPSEPMYRVVTLLQYTKNFFIPSCTCATFCAAKKNPNKNHDIPFSVTVQ